MRFATLAMALVAFAGCLRSTSHQCADSSECPGGRCIQPEGACAFDDAVCSTGLRFGDDTGPRAGQCVAGAGGIDAATTDGPAGDGGAVDARPDAMVIPHDEDGDTVPDAVDNCPHVVNGNQQNTGETDVGRSADGVGDACDPDPDLSGNTILLFDPLTSLVAGRWTTLLATEENDAIKLDPDGFLTSTSTGFPGRIFVANQVRMTNPGANGANASLASSYASSSNRIACIRAATPSNIIVDGPGASFPYAAATINAGAAVTLRQTIDANRWGCSTTTNGQTHTAFINGTPNPPGGRIFLGALLTVVYVDYVIVISRP